MADRSFEEDAEWACYLPDIANRLYFALSDPPSLEVYEDFLEMGMEAMRECLLELYVQLPLEDEDDLLVLRYAIDVFTSLRYQAIWSPMERITTGIPLRSPQPKTEGPVRLLNIRNALNPEKFLAEITNGLDFVTSLNTTEKPPGSLSWSRVSAVWKKAMRIPIDLHSLD
ncbi:unnamed protein product [Symbiodinium necroappetens]|uniref:Uncharacterized protein n=1 Tax=Symbiodinium necroappetens TaxID=1628268 RepID=A0A812W5D9_9DINO|nr:unnamed protein product [Symbiodinium necroappetens]